MNNAVRFVRCRCGAHVPDERGPLHRYLASAAACWRLYTEVLAKEYTDKAYYPVHRLSVDTWAVQHPGEPSRQTIQSAAVHLVRLFMAIERQFPLERLNDVMLKQFSARDRTRMHWLTPPADMGGITVLDVAGARSAQEHCDMTWTWARATWGAWHEHHAQIRAWADAYL